MLISRTENTLPSNMAGDTTTLYLDWYTGVGLKSENSPNSNFPLGLPGAERFLFK
jgi:hypothetical protein